MLTRKPFEKPIQCCKNIHDRTTKNISSPWLTLDIVKFDGYFIELLQQTTAENPITLKL